MDTPILAAFKPPSHDHDDCVETALAAAGEICARRGRRLTALRRHVLKLIWGGHGPVRAYDLLDRLRTAKPSAAPPTVYRALEFLIDSGLVRVSPQDRGVIAPGREAWISRATPDHRGTGCLPRLRHGGRR